LQGEGPKLYLPPAGAGVRMRRTAQG
jgi:hypothetical protein